MKPIVIESYRSIEYQGVIYKRRLRINGLNTLHIDSNIGTNIYHSNTRFCVIDEVDEIKVCKLLQIPHKPNYRIYIEMDRNMCAFHFSATKKD